MWLISTHIVCERLYVMHHITRILCSKFLECPTKVFEECGVQSKNENCQRGWDFRFELVQSNPLRPEKENFIRTWDFEFWVAKTPPPPPIKIWSGLGTFSFELPRIPRLEYVSNLKNLKCNLDHPSKKYFSTALCHQQHILFRSPQLARCRAHFPREWQQFCGSCSCTWPCFRCSWVGS